MALFKSFFAVAAVAGLAFTANDQNAPTAYGDALTSLSREQVDVHAQKVFARADRDGDGAVNVEEYTALMVVTAELARLNGFISIETDGEPCVIGLPAAARSALLPSEHARIAAVARSGFYAYAGADGVMNEDEYAKSQLAAFDDADGNRNKLLKRYELGLFAQKQAALTAGA